MAAPAQIDAPPCKPSHGIFAGCSRRHATLLAFSAESRLNWLTRDRKGLKGPRRNCALTAIRHHLGDFWWSLCVRAVAEGTSGGFFLGWGPIELSSVHERQAARRSSVLSLTLDSPGPANHASFAHL